MAKRRRTPPPDPPSLREAVRCVLLAIDPGKHGGWALFVSGVLLDLGVARNAADRERVVAHAIETARLAGADKRGLPLMIVAEDWSAGGWKSHKQLLGMGAAWGRWQEQLELAGVPRTRVTRVLPQRWRARVLRATTKDAALRYVAARWPDVSITTHDAAEAACVGAWGIVSPEVADRVPSQRRRGSP